MADIAIFRINYKSDFILTLISDAGWLTPFCIKFWTGMPSQAYFVGFDGTTYTHCAPVDGEPTKLRVQFDDHHLPIGDLKFQIGYHFTVADFPTSVEDEVLNQASVIIEVDDAPAQVMLDFNGETAPEIEFSLPAYANEAQRIANEEQRIAHEAIRIVNEESRIAAETIRQQNEAQRIAQETARVNEFATLKSQSQAATRDANDAATLANQKSQLAADKAALADDAATLANQKAQLAADKAALANDAAQLANEKADLAQQKAEYAQTQGGYAKDQGDYAKDQGDYAKAQGDIAQSDHERAETDHGIAVDDHTQAGNDHTRAESDHGIAADDHTRAGNDHTRAESDHGIAADDHTQAGNDHTRAESDHGIAADDHTQAGNDHTRAESDHTRAESDHAAVEVYVDSLGAFDISAYHATGGVLAKYADLTAALGTNGANIPEALRKGGMSVKYAQSSDNKYAQYRLTNQSWSVNIADWQEIGSAEFSTGEKVSEVGIDDEPIANSENLVKSGGVNAVFEDVIGVKAVNENVAASSTWETGSFNANLEEVTSGSVRTKIDLTDYQGCEINFHCYGYGGFIMSDGTVKNVENYNSPLASSNLITLTVPNGASYFCITTGASEASFPRYALFTREYKKGKIKEIAEEVVQSATKNADTIALDNAQLGCEATNVQAAFEEYHVDKNYTIDEVVEIPVTANTAVTRSDTEVLFDTVYEAGKDCFFWIYPTQELANGAYTQITFIKEDGTTIGAPGGLLIKGTKVNYKLPANIKGYYFTFQASQIASTGNVRYGFYIEKDAPSLTTDAINNNESVDMGRLAYQYQNNPNIKDISGILNGLRSVIIGGANDKLRYVRNIWNYHGYLPNVFVVDNSFLNSKNLSRIDGNATQVSSGGTLTFEKFLYESDDDILSIIDNTPLFTYYRFEFYIYSAHRDFPTTSSISFLGHGITRATSTISDTPSEFVKLVRCEGYVNGNVTTYLNLSLSATASSLYEVGEYGITGVKFAFLDNNELEKDIVGDWEIDATNFPTLKEDIFSEQGTNNLRNNIRSGFNGYSWNRAEEIREYLSMFIARYKNKAVDEYNRVLVSFNGDSIIGSQLDDIDHTEGYNTGDFPPNMSRMIMARMFYDRYKFSDEDTVFRNLSHSDWTKQGFNISNGGNTFNRIEVYGCQDGDYAQISVSGYKYFKLIWSEYMITDNDVNTYSFDIMRSTDGGSTFSLVESITTTSAKRLMQDYKIYVINPAESYIYKVVPTSGYAKVCLWGCEMWNNPRLDVVVEAFSGTWTAEVLANKLDGYYSEYHKPALIITDILALNDYAVNTNINWWLENSVELGKKIKEKGTLLLPMTTHGANFVNCGYGLWKSFGYNVIDIASKLKDQRFNEDKNITNNTDGLHLSNYGNSYFFEELKRVFDSVLLT